MSVVAAMDNATVLLPPLPHPSPSQPTPYKVSTITAVATLSTCIDLDVFFDNLKIRTPEQDKDCECDCLALETEGTILFAGKGSHANVQTRGVRPASSSKKKVATTAPRFFDHQVTLVYRTASDERMPSYKREVHNIKVFHNGNMQLTGVKSLDGGRLAVEHIAQMVANIAISRPEVLPLGLLNAPPIAANFRACLINSDFNAGYVLRRDRLYALLSGPSYSVQCVFETYYPGVKALFMWNASKVSEGQDGVCLCGVPCNGRGDGNSLGNCRKITMSVFQSGCCIITGAHTYAQLDDAYAFMTGVFVRHRQLLARPPLPPPTIIAVAAKPLVEHVHILTLMNPVSVRLRVDKSQP